MFESSILTANSTSSINFASELSLSLDGRWAIVGAPNELFPQAGGQDLGAAYLFDLSQSAPVLVAKLSQTPTLTGSLGGSTAISGDGGLVVVGIPSDTLGDQPGVFDPDVVPGVGSVIIFTNLDGVVTLVSHLFEDTPQRQAAFGTEVALSADGTRLFVTANDLTDPLVDPASPFGGDARKVLVYDMTGGTPVLIDELRPVLNPALQQGSGFGSDMMVSADGTILAVSAPSEAGEIDPVTGFPAPARGAVYVWDLSGAEPAVLFHIRLPLEMPSLSFGSNMALSADGSTLAVGGVRLDDPDATFAGKVFVYDLTGSQPVLMHVFAAADTDPADVFGASLALSSDGNRIVIGATGWDGEVFDPLLGTGDFNVGQSYVYDLSGATPVLVETLRASDEDRFDASGFTVGISGDGTRVLVGAGDGDGTPFGSGGVSYVDQGSAYVYDVADVPPPAPQIVREPLTTGNDSYVAPGNDRYDVLARGGDDDVVTGSGNDRILGAAGSDTLSAGRGDDLLRGGSGNDSLEGGGGNDTLTGDGGNDTLHGGMGDDRLTGGGSADLLIGGLGADSFVYTSFSQSSVRNSDTIADFTVGMDVIDLSAMDAAPRVAGVQQFVFIGDSAFGGAVGELRFVQDVAAGVTRVEADLSGNGSANLVIDLVGLLNLTVDDFVI